MYLRPPSARTIPVRTSGIPKKVALEIKLNPEVLQRLQAQQNLRNVASTSQLIEEIIECWLADHIVGFVEGQRGPTGGNVDIDEGEGDADRYEVMVRRRR